MQVIAGVLALECISLFCGAGHFLMLSLDGTGLPALITFAAVLEGIACLGLLGTVLLIVDNGHHEYNLVPSESSSSGALLSLIGFCLLFLVSLFPRFLSVLVFIFV